MTIARNLFLDQRKRQQRRNTDSLDDDTKPVIEVKSYDENPEQYVLREEFSGYLQRTLNDFPEHHQTAFVLGIMQKRSYKEIADITGWSQATVKINIFRARKRMADALTEFQG
ncbi:MAG: RNA polymerase sigma factor [bacterium]|nr:RNA polymerase sigma factor [bacterium]